MPIASTSQQAYELHVRRGFAVTQRERILAALRNAHDPMSRSDLALLFGSDPVDGGPPIPLASICGRVNALLEAKLIELAYVAADPSTGHRVEHLRAVCLPPHQRTFEDWLR